ncbi:MAG: DUF721 domain-containing protein [Pseudomonadota bacterium]
MPGPVKRPENAQHRKRGHRGFARAGSLVEGQIRKVGEARGFAVSRLITHWSEIVGADLSKHCRPVRAAYGRGSFGATLTLIAPGAAAPMLQARLPELLERVNACYGFRAISRIKITQTAPQGFADPQAAFEPAKKPAPDRAKDPLTDAKIRQVKDPDLKAALSALSDHVPRAPTADT